jgi:hypothetical protein
MLLCVLRESSYVMYVVQVGKEQAEPYKFFLNHIGNIEHIVMGIFPFYVPYVNLPMLSVVQITCLPVTLTLYS